MRSIHKAVSVSLVVLSVAIGSFAFSQPVSAAATNVQKLLTMLANSGIITQAQMAELLSGGSIPVTVTAPSNISQTATSSVTANVSVSGASSVTVNGVGINGGIASCSGYTSRLYWGKVPGATSYNVRVDNTANPWISAGQTCLDVKNPGDLCIDGVAETYKRFTFVPGSTNYIWVEAVPVGTVVKNTIKIPPASPECSNTSTAPVGTGTTANTSGSVSAPSSSGAGATADTASSVSTGPVATSTTIVAPKPTVNLSVTSATLLVRAGKDVTISWSSVNAEACAVSLNGANTKQVGPSGTMSSGPLRSKTIVSVTCTGAGGSTTKSQTVYVLGLGAAVLSAGASDIVAPLMQYLISR